MTLAKVIGIVTSSTRHPLLQGVKLLMVQPLNDRLEPHGRATLAVDTVGAGVGERVLIVEEGAAVERFLHVTDAPVRSVIIGIVEHVEVQAYEDVVGRA